MEYQRNMNECDARGEDDLGRGSRSSVFMLCLQVSKVVDERISMGIEF